MFYAAEYMVDPNGHLFWMEGLRVVEPAMQALYRTSHLAGYVMETFASLGVQTGMA